MSFINEMLGKRAAAIAETRAVLDVAAAEARALTGEELAKIDKTEAEVAGFDATIAQVRAHDVAESEQRAAMAGQETAQASNNSAPEKSDSELVRSLARGDVRSLTFSKRDMSKGSTGAPVPTSFYDEVLLVARAVGPMLTTSTVINTVGGENLQIPALTAYSTAGITAEAGTISESDPTLQAFITLNAYKYSFLTQVSTELIEDAGVDILALISANVGNALGYNINQDLTTGNGSGKPFGIVARASAGVAGSAAVAGSFTFDNLVDLAYAADSAARALPGFGFMASGSAIAAMRKLQDGAGSYVFQPSLSEGTPDRVLGYQLWENPAMEAPAATKVSVIAGHLPSYMVRQVGGVKLERSDDFAFADGLVTFRATMRVDGNLPLVAHVKKFTGGAAS